MHGDAPLPPTQLESGLRGGRGYDQIPTFCHSSLFPSTGALRDYSWRRMLGEQCRCTLFVGPRPLAGGATWAWTDLDLPTEESSPFLLTSSVNPATSAPKGIVRFWQKGRRTCPARYYQWCYFFLLVLRPQAFQTTWLQTGTRRALHIYLPACISSFGRRHRRLTIAPQSPTVVQTEKRFVPFPEYQTKLIETISRQRATVRFSPCSARPMAISSQNNTGNWWPERPAWVPMNKVQYGICVCVCV